MHRDLKPQNILLDDNFDIKVVSVITELNSLSQIDFGDAKHMDELEDNIP
jgi:serine/threonine protein kinase